MATASATSGVAAPSNVVVVPSGGTICPQAAAAFVDLPSGGTPFLGLPQAPQHYADQQQQEFAAFSAAFAVAGFATTSDDAAHHHHHPFAAFPDDAQHFSQFGHPLFLPPHQHHFMPEGTGIPGEPLHNNTSSASISADSLPPPNTSSSFILSADFACSAGGVGGAFPSGTLLLEHLHQQPPLQPPQPQFHAAAAAAASFPLPSLTMISSSSSAATPATSSASLATSFASATLCGKFIKSTEDGSEEAEEAAKFVQQTVPSSTQRRGQPSQRGMRRRVGVAAVRKGRNSGGVTTTVAGNVEAGGNVAAAVGTVTVSRADNENDSNSIKEDDATLLNMNQHQPVMNIAATSYSCTNTTTVASTYSMPSGVTAELVASPLAAEAEQPKRCMHCTCDIREHTMLAVRGGAHAPEPEFFHCDCLKCSECAEPLEHAPKCYVRDGRVFCAGCYAKNFGVCCAMCERRIAPTDWVRRAREFVYHLACFKCEYCKRQLSSREQFALDDQHRPPPAIPRLLCKQHYLELVRGEQCSPKQKAKRVRTTFGEEQLAILQEHFKVDSNPDGADLERIANLTGLSKRVTQVWFQNSRARQKKYHGHGPCRKPHGGSMPGGGVSGGGLLEDICLGGCRSATMTPSSSSNGGGAYTGGAQSPLIFGGGGSTGSESDGFRQMLAGSSSPPATNGLQPQTDLPVLQNLERSP